MTQANISNEPKVALSQANSHAHLLNEKEKVFLLSLLLLLSVFAVILISSDCAIGELSNFERHTESIHEINGSSSIFLHCY